MAGGPSHACGMSPAKEDGPQTIVVNGKMRNFIVRIPATTDTLHPHPLVYLWHGAGGSSAAFDSKNYGNIRKSWGDKAVLMMPDALIFDKTGATTWMRDAPDDLAFFDAMMAWIETRACFDKGHIFSTGHSSGAFWSHTLGCQRGNIIRGIAPISGGPREMNNCVGNVAAWIAHGEQDDNIAIKTGIAGRDFWRGRNDCPSTPAVATTPTPCVAYDGCKPGFPVQWCAFTGGHIWPAFATDAIWAFFSRL